MVASARKIRKDLSVCLRGFSGNIRRFSMLSSLITDQEFSIDMMFDLTQITVVEQVHKIQIGKIRAFG